MLLASLRSSCVWIALSAGVAAQGNLIVVDNGPCPGKDFDTIQDAVDAAADNSIIIVRSSSGAPFDAFAVEGKDLRIVALGEVLLDPAQPVRLRNTDADRQILLRGFTSPRRLDVQGCQGPIWIEDCRFGDPSGSTPETGAALTDCGPVTLVRSTFHGSDAPAPALPGVLAVDVASLQIWNGLVTGGRGTVDARFAQDGAPGVYASGDTLLAVYGADLRGGAGGTDPSLVTALGTDGGDAVFGASGTRLLRFDSQLTGGAAGVTRLGPGAQGRPVDGDILVEVLPGTARTFAVEPAVVLEGQAAHVSVQAQDGDYTMLWAGTLQQPVLVPSMGGTLATNLWYVAVLGALPGVPLELQPKLAHGLAEKDSVLPLHAQLGFLNAGQKVLSPPSLYIVADAKFHTHLGCP